MASIESEQVQTVIERLVKDIPQNAPRQIWIGGRRSTNTKWMYMNETEFKEPVTNPYEETIPCCLHVRLCKDSNPVYIVDNCNENNSNSHLLCQMDSGSCYSISGESNFGGKCYKKTKYNGYEPTRIDWYSGQTYCSQTYLDGEIAYSYLDDKSSTNSVKTLVGGSSDCIQLWLGVGKKLWFWEKGRISDTTKQLIHYFNWFDKDNTDNADQDCIYIDVDEKNKWFTHSCTTPPRKFVICMNETPTTSTTKNEYTTYTATSSTTSSSTTSSSTTSSSTTSNPSTSSPTTSRTAQSSEHNPTPTANGIDLTSTTSTPNKSNRNNKFNPIYIIPVVVVLLVIIIGLPVFLVMKKKRQTPKDHSSINDGLHDPPQKQSPSDDPEYAQINPSRNDDDDVLDPYGTTGTSPTGNNDVRHKEMPSGDLYALSSKQLNKSDDDKNKEVMNPEELYAKPNKKSNQKLKMDGIREDKQSTEHTHDMDTSKPSGDKKSPGIKHTEHFESESGDLYATVTK